MRSKSRIILTMVLVMAMVAMPLQALAATGDVESDVVDAYKGDDNYEVIYRMYNPNTGEHLYTNSVEERKTLYLAKWDAEGIGWVAPKSSSTPIYRLCNGLEHHYTKDVVEANYLSHNGWTNEGVAFYSSDDQVVPMYRLCNPNSAGPDMHHYTKDTNERDTLALWHGWIYEGTAWYIMNVDTSTIPLPPLPERYAYNITNTASYATIEADVKLGGTGQGNHAKLVFQTPYSAVSFGIQYDMWAGAPYTNTTYYMCEYVLNNDPGGQQYFKYNYSSKNEYHHLMATYEKGGICRFYVDGNEVGSVWNPNLDQDALYMSVEGAGRNEGDTLDVVFRNIRLKSGGVYDANKSWPVYYVRTNEGVTLSHTGFDALTPGTGTVSIGGTIVGIGGLDWDSAYDRVSGVVRLTNAI